MSDGDWHVLICMSKSYEMGKRGHLVCFGKVKHTIVGVPSASKKECHLPGSNSPV